MCEHPDASIQCRTSASQHPSGKVTHYWTVPSTQTISEQDLSLSSIHLAISSHVSDSSRRNSVPQVLTGESQLACWEDPLMTIFAPQQKNQPQMQQQVRPKRRESSADGLDNRFALLTIEDVYGHLYALCKDQHGCRFLQQKLAEDRPFVIDAIFEELYPHMIDIMMGSLFRPISGSIRMSHQRYDRPFW